MAWRVPTAIKSRSDFGKRTTQERHHRQVPCLTRYRYSSYLLAKMPYQRADDSPAPKTATADQREQPTVHYTLVSSLTSKKTQLLGSLDRIMERANLQYVMRDWIRDR